MRVLEAREIGHGILVENDGYISPDDNRSIIQEIEKILRRENERYQEVIKKGGAISELNHPESSLIDLDRASHIITETWWEGNRLIGKMKLLTSPAYMKEGIISCVGDMAANLLRQGVTLGISSRGVGSLTKNGEYNQVQEDFELICFDLVSSPSTPGSYLFKEDETADSVDETSEMIESSKPKPDTFNKSLSMMSKLDNFLNR